MLGQLPQTLKIRDKEYEIRTDFRNILTIISAYNDKDLTDKEKVFVCLNRIFKNVHELPKEQDAYLDAFKAATEFIECRLSSDRPSPKVVNWAKDEQLIFPAINKVAGTEIRALSYLHWWTFLGYFQSIDRDDLWGTVLVIRQKKAKHKKLEKWEKEFYSANRDLCSMEAAEDRRSTTDTMKDLYDQLIKEGGASNAE